MLSWLHSLRQPNGAFTVHVDGETDSRYGPHAP